MTNSSDDNESPWMMPLWILTSARVGPPANISIFQSFMVFIMKFMTLSDILYIFILSSTKFAGPYHRSFCSQSIPLLHFSTLFLSL